MARQHCLKKTTQLKRMVYSPELSFLMEAHSGLSAKLVEEAGFHGIWASGLSMSAMLGVRDNNEASWTQVLEVVEFMSDATKIPILLDGDTGYGNFNSIASLSSLPYSIRAKPSDATPRFGSIRPDKPSSPIALTPAIRGRVCCDGWLQPVC